MQLFCDSHSLLLLHIPFRFVISIFLCMVYVCCVCPVIFWASALNSLYCSLASLFALICVSVSAKINVCCLNYHLLLYLLKLFKDHKLFFKCLNQGTLCWNISLCPEVASEFCTRIEAASSFHLGKAPCGWQCKYVPFLRWSHWRLLYVSLDENLADIEWVFCLQKCSKCFRILYSSEHFVVLDYQPFFKMFHVIQITNRMVQ